VISAVKTCAAGADIVIGGFTKVSNTNNNSNAIIQKLIARSKGFNIFHLILLNIINFIVERL